jgi:aminoglycoside 2''-phosphotransferase
VSPLLDEAERAAVARFWDGYLNDDAMFDFTPALIHSDLGMEHVLVDDGARRVTGVIDFGDARVGDPALDFVGMGTTLQRQVLDSYGGPQDAGMLARGRIYDQVGPFHDVLYGLLIGHDGHRSAGLRGIRERIIAK